MVNTRTPCTIMSTEISPGIFGSLVSYSSLWLLNDLVLAVFSSLLLVGCPCDIVPLNLGMTSFEVIVAIMPVRSYSYSYSSYYHSTSCFSLYSTSLRFGIFVRVIFAEHHPSEPELLNWGGGGGTNPCDAGLDLSGSWQQGHSATYNAPSRI